MKTNLDELDIAINLDAYCTDEFFEKIQNSVEKTFQFLYVVLMQFKRKDLVEKYKKRLILLLLINFHIQCGKHLEIILIFYIN